MPTRKRYLFVCTNERPASAPKGSCAARGALPIHAELKRRLQERGLAELEVRACRSSCLDLCEQGPTIVVEPDHYVYAGVAQSDVADIVDALAEGRCVERLLLDGPKPG